MIYVLNVKFTPDKCHGRNNTILSKKKKVDSCGFVNYRFSYIPVDRWIDCRHSGNFCDKTVNGYTRNSPGK